jgi:head-tail adaptor
MEQTNVSQSKEYHTAEQRLPVTTHRVRIRYLQGMSSDKRLVWGQKLPGTTLDSDITLDSADEMDGNSRARILEIRSVIDEDARKRTMIMFCDEIGVKSGG